MPWRRSPDDRRRAALSGATVGPLADYLGREFPAPDLALSQAPLLAIDLETTGLDPRRDRMLSVGFVPVDGLRVDLAGAGHLLIRDEAGVGQSATFHGLTDDVVAEGEPVDVVLASVLEALGGRALLAHFARIETAFLDAACRRVLGGGMPCLVVDTLELERRAQRGGWGEAPAAESVRLGAARERRGLPRYKAHDALVDALACAELYLAQVAELEQQREHALMLRDVLTG